MMRAYLVLNSVGKLPCFTSKDNVSLRLFIDVLYRIEEIPFYLILLYFLGNKWMMTFFQSFF